MKTCLYDNQKAAIEKLEKYKVGALFMDPGSGKTRTTVELIRSRRDIECVLWFCPFQTKENLTKELIKCGMDLNTVEIVGIESLSNGDVLYLDLLKKYESKQNYMCVCDESLKIKNDSKRTNRILRISKNAKYKLILNGTPISKNYLDLYRQMEFLSPKILKMDYSTFYNTFVEETTVNSPGKRKMKYVSGFGNLEYLFNLISPFIFESKLKLNINIHRKEVFFQSSEETKQDYNELKRHFLDILGDGGSGIQLLQTMQHSYACDENKVRELEKLLGNLNDKKVLIFCKYIDEQNLVYNLIKNENHKVLSLQKHAFGLNLQEYNHIIFFNQSWDYALMEQAEKRIYRIGQKQDCYIYTFKSDLGLDNMINKNLNKKSDLLNDIKNKLIEELEELL